jgi:hypothetical protein
MSKEIDTLYEAMEEAVRSLDFEQATRLRDRIGLIRGGATPAEAEQADLSGLARQQPGAMGLGTSRQHVAPPPGWQPPPKPDPMTQGRSRRGARRK